MTAFSLESLPVATQDGHFVSEIHMRVAEVLRDYDRNLEIEWIPDAARTNPLDKPFRVVHTDPRSGYRYVVCYADELDGRLLERVISMDSAKKGNILSDIDARNAAVKLLAQKEAEEKRAEAHDMAAHALKSHLNNYSMKDPQTGRKIIIRDFGNRRK